MDHYLFSIIYGIILPIDELQPGKIRILWGSWLKVESYVRAYLLYLLATFLVRLSCCEMRIGYHRM